MAHNALGEARPIQATAPERAAAPSKAPSNSIRDSPTHQNLGTVLLDMGDSTCPPPILDRAIQLHGPKPDAAYAHYLRREVPCSPATWTKLSAT